MAITKKTTTKKSVKKVSAKKALVKKAVAKKRVCGCDQGGVCTCGEKCNCKNCNCHGAGSVKYTHMWAAWRAFWRRGFVEWAGTSSRSEYWWSLLANIVVCVLFVFAMILTVALDNALFTEHAVFTGILLVVGFLYVIASIIPSISMLTRRMHDAGLSAWFWLLYLTSFVPWIGSYMWSMVVLVFALLPTQTVDNPYHKFNK